VNSQIATVTVMRRPNYCSVFSPFRLFIADPHSSADTRYWCHRNSVSLSVSLSCSRIVSKRINISSHTLLDIW